VAEPAILQNQPAESEDQRSRIARMVMQLFGHWQISTDEQLELLGLRPKSRAVLSRYRRGEPLPLVRDMLDRAAYLLAIHRSLRTLYPENPEICYGWVKMRNRALGNLTPLEVMLKEGLLGLAKVSRHLDVRLTR